MVAEVVAEVDSARPDKSDAGIWRSADAAVMLNVCSQTMTSHSFIQALFDIRTELRKIRILLEDDDGEQGDEEEDP